jgi:thioredoxin reductase (NADPH)
MNDSQPGRAEREAKPSGTSPIEVDCAVVGAGLAGLSAAINLSRMRRDVMVVDARDRFIWGHVIHNYLGFPNGIPAVELRRLGWHQAARFGARLMLGLATRAAREGQSFRLRIEPPPMGEAGRDADVARLFEAVTSPVDVLARTVILATGVLGHFPDFPGRDECVGRSLFWCLHCDGYESIGKVVGVVGHDENAVETALGLLDFTNRVTLVAGRPEGFDVPASRLSDLEANGIAAYPSAVAEYRCIEGQIEALVLDDLARTAVSVEHVYTVQHSFAPNDLALQLGVELTPGGQIAVTSEQHTNVPGVYAAGDATNLHDHQVSAAVHEGNQAAAGANYHLYRPVQKDPRGR